MTPDELRAAADRATELLKGGPPFDYMDDELQAEAPDLLAVLAPAARQLADTQDECERLNDVIVRMDAEVAFAHATIVEQGAEVQRLRTVVKQMAQIMAERDAAVDAAARLGAAVEVMLRLEGVWSTDERGTYLQRIGALARLAATFDPEWAAAAVGSVDPEGERTCPDCLDCPNWCDGKAPARPSVCPTCGYGSDDTDDIDWDVMYGHERCKNPECVTHFRNTGRDA